MATDFDEYIQQDIEFRSRLFGRLNSDCKYYLGYGNRAKKHLWAGDEVTHIALMKALWQSFPAGEKPRVSFEDILDYERQMIGNVFSLDEMIENQSKFKNIEDFAKYLIDRLSPEGCGPENGLEYDRYAGGTYNALLTFDIEEHRKAKTFSVYEVDTMTNQTMEVHSCPASLRGLTKLLKSIEDREISCTNDSLSGKVLMFYPYGKGNGHRGKNIGIITSVKHDGVHIRDTKKLLGEQNYTLSIDELFRGFYIGKYDDLKPRARSKSVDKKIEDAICSHRANSRTKTSKPEKER